MKIAVASGKGGTGKTTIAVSLALSLQGDGPQVHDGGAEAGREEERAQGTGPEVVFLDCDVEAPDAHLYLNPRFRESRPATIPIPRVDSRTCTLCGDCSEVCRYHAIALLGENVQVFPELCHGCGSCGLICAPNAISEEPRSIGLLQAGEARGMRFAQGTVNVGEPLAVPVIKQLKSWMDPEPRAVTILDSPPGTSCPMVETVTGADFVVLVTEPTPAGVHDLELADEVLWELGIPAGVVVNRDGTGYQELEESCALSRLPVLLRIPFHRQVAEGLARGGTLLEIRPDLQASFSRMAREIQQAVALHRSSDSSSPDPRTHLAVRHDMEVLLKGRQP